MRLFSSYSFLASMLVAIVMGCILSATGLAKPQSGGYTMRRVFFRIARPADGKKYPNPVQETYELTREGQLRYTAYFGNMPIEMNHMDSVEWSAGAHAERVFAAIAPLVEEPTTGLKELPDDKSAPDGAYVVGLTRNHSDSSRCVSDRKSKAWAAIDAAFRTLVAHFEKATGRPKLPKDLPQ